MTAAFFSNLSSPPLLFFFLGVAAVLARSDLEIPNQIAKFLSIYLLFSIGFKGGVALAESSFDLEIILTLLAAIGLGALVPIYVFFIVKRRMAVADAAAVAATYGSVSAVTFVTATGYLDMQGIGWSGHLVAAMALMESPAIIVGLLMYKRFATSDDDGVSFSLSHILREACLNGSVFLILGSMVAGWISGPGGMAQISVFVKGIFLGVLCLFLLDMGIVATRRLRDFRESSNSQARQQFLFMLPVALLVPIVNATLGLGIAVALGLGEGDALLMLILAASASYIAVPAAMRLVLPEANPGIYLPMSLAMTFPFNLLIGIPSYHAMVRWAL